jgi:hypothetical protein
MKRLRLTFIVLFAFTVAPLLRAQTIADLAKRTEEAKAKKAEQATADGDKGKTDGTDSKDAPKKTFTNTDLVNAVGPTTADAASEPKAAPSELRSADSKDAPKPTISSGEVKDENWWRSHALVLKRQRDADMVTLAAARAHYNSLPDEAKGVLGVPVVDAWMKARAEVSRLEGVVANDIRAVNDFEEDARRASIPPGWLREK